MVTVPHRGNVRHIAGGFRFIRPGSPEHLDQIDRECRQKKADAAPKTVSKPK